MADLHAPLKLCPHCGCGDVRATTSKDDFENNRFEVGCFQCGAAMGWNIDSQPWGDDLEAKKAGTIAAWNRRTPSQDAETIKALEEQVAYWKGASDRMAARNHELNEQAAEFDARLSLRDTFICEKDLWHEFATTVLPSASLSASQKEQEHV